MSYTIDLGAKDEILIYKDDIPVSMTFEEFAHFLEKRPEILRDLHTHVVQKQTFQECARIAKTDLVTGYMMDLLEENSRSDADPGL